MTRRHIHYEAAFEDYLRSRGVPYVPVDETRRVVFAGEKIKSFDFLVYPGEGQHWIVDVKGRQFPYLGPNGKHYWENWTTKEDLEGLTEWEDVFGNGFEARFVFAYMLQGPTERWPTLRPYAFRGEYYTFYSVRLADYRASCRERSDKWDTVSVPRRIFRRIISPMEEPQGEGSPKPEEGASSG